MNIIKHFVHAAGAAALAVGLTGCDDGAKQALVDSHLEPVLAKHAENPDALVDYSNVMVIRKGDTHEIGSVAVDAVKNINDELCVSYTALFNIQLDEAVNMSAEKVHGETCIPSPSLN